MKQISKADVFVRSQAYVWCDTHCAIHEATCDYYQEGLDECAPINWRSVWVLGQEGEEF